jgi:hypothetical protein
MLGGFEGYELIGTCIKWDIICGTCKWPLHFSGTLAGFHML